MTWLRGARWAAPVRLHVVLIVLAAVLPLLLLAAFLARGYVAAETERFERSLRDTALDTTLALEREITATVATLQTLAVSPTLQDESLAAFHAQAVAVRDLVGANIILRDPSGRQLLNTFLPWGAPLPATSALVRWDPEVLSTDRPVVTGHYRGLVGGDHLFAVIVPVRRDGRIAWLLHASISTTRLRDILARSRLPPDAGIAIADRDFTVLARRDRHEEVVGTRGTAAAQMAAMAGNEMTIRQVGRDGREMFTAFRRLSPSGWIVAAAVPVETVLAPLRRTLWIAAGAAACLLALGLAGAWFFGSRLARAIRRLATLGAALEDGRSVTPPLGAVREVNEAGAALATAAARHGLMLHELNHRVRNTLATCNSLLRLSARHATSIPDLEARMSERIRSLGKTHVLLTGTHWTEAGIEEVLRNELAMHDAAGHGRVLLEGPPVMLPARQAVSMGMLGHELATNAAKHGALSTPDGRVEIRWTLHDRPGAPPHLSLVWQEIGGPPAAAPRRSGFGTQLIERGLARDLGARVASDYRPDGLRFTLSMPLGQPAPPAPWSPDPGSAPPRPAA